MLGVFVFMEGLPKDPKSEILKEVGVSSGRMFVVMF